MDPFHKFHSPCHFREDRASKLLKCDSRVDILIIDTDLDERSILTLQYLPSLPSKQWNLVMICAHLDGGTVDFVALRTGLERHKVANTSDQPGRKSCTK